MASFLIQIPNIVVNGGQYNSTRYSRMIIVVNQYVSKRQIFVQTVVVYWTLGVLCCYLVFLFWSGYFWRSLHSLIPQVYWWSWILSNWSTSNTLLWWHKKVDWIDLQEQWCSFWEDQVCQCRSFNRRGCHIRIWILAFSLQCNKL